ncbi:hypothetical protein N7540_008552 [Penicillium herquei]|nr:hypothetical protein N7540_008552 [Penicillium herquei]
MARFSYLKLLTSTLLITSTLACTTDEECSLNGICKSNSCICDSGWTNSDCGKLDLRPGPRSNGYNRTSEGISSWCNGITRDPNNKDLYHLFISEFTHGCGLDYWSPYSHVIRAESQNGPLGPYTSKQEIRPTFAHNPTVIWSEKDEQYLLYSIGCPQSVSSTCEGMSFTCGPGNDENGESGINVLSSTDLINWSKHGQVFSGMDNAAWDADVTNPGPLHVHSSSHTFSETILSYRACPYNGNGTELITIASAADYPGPYTPIHPRKPIFEQTSEDPFMWMDKRGNFHLLVHSLLSDAGFGDGANVGRHAYSRSWDGPWTFDMETVAYNTTVEFSDGSSINYYRRERPNLFFSDDGDMRPLFLSTGVQEVDSSASYSLIQPIGEGN